MSERLLVSQEFNVLFKCTATELESLSQAFKLPNLQESLKTLETQRQNLQAEVEALTDKKAQVTTELASLEAERDELAKERQKLKELVNA